MFATAARQGEGSVQNPKEGYNKLALFMCIFLALVIPSAYYFSYVADSKPTKDGVVQVVPVDRIETLKAIIAKLDKIPIDSWEPSAWAYSAEKDELVIMVYASYRLSYWDYKDYEGSRQKYGGADMPAESAIIRPFYEKIHLAVTKRIKVERENKAKEVTDILLK